MRTALAGVSTSTWNHARRSFRVSFFLSFKIDYHIRNYSFICSSGKTSSWRCLLQALEATSHDSKSDFFVIDPKAIDKESLFGVLDSTTLEWTDGIFTAIVRSILKNMRGELRPDRRHWIVFDGDIDPEWAENLNSALDDNGLLTLPSGERLRIPSNMRIVFEVDTLENTTMATITRCGMIWYSSDCISDGMILSFTFCRLLRKRNISLAEISETRTEMHGDSKNSRLSTGELAQIEFFRVLSLLFFGREDYEAVDIESGINPQSAALLPTALAWAMAESQKPKSSLDKDKDTLKSRLVGNIDAHAMSASRERFVGTISIILEQGLAILSDHCAKFMASKYRGLDVPKVRFFAGRWALHAMVRNNILWTLS
jgi:hypothetical protein